MKLISHRGNLLGKQEALENNPDQIDKVLSNSLDCEIDVFTKNNQLYLGHDFPKYIISLDWILSRSKNLWVHCKDIETLKFLFNYKQINIFWHENDKVTFTSHGHIWSHTDTEFIKNSIIVLPERNNRKKIEEKCFGICSDYILYYNKDS